MNYQEGPAGYDPIYASLLQKRMGPLAHLGSHRMVFNNLHFDWLLLFRQPDTENLKENQCKSKQAWYTTSPVKRNKDIEGFYCSLAY